MGNEWKLLVDIGTAIYCLWMTGMVLWVVYKALRLIIKCIILLVSYKGNQDGEQNAPHKETINMTDDLKDP